MLISIFNYNTLEKVHSIEAHTDYIRSLAVHPTQPLLLSCGDDMVIKLWNWDNKWECAKVFHPCILFVFLHASIFMHSYVDPICFYIGYDDMRLCICLFNLFSLIVLRSSKDTATT